MIIEKFEDVVAWQKARIFVNEIYKKFSLSRDFGFRDQILRASVSVMNNIAEGFEKRSNKDFKNPKGQLLLNNYSWPKIAQIEYHSLLKLV